MRHYSSSDRMDCYAFGDDVSYSFSQQQKDFIKLQFKYGVLLKRRLDAGTLPGQDGSVIIPEASHPSSDQQQAYYDAHLWLTTQTLDNPYVGWREEFKSAIESEDLNWLAGQIGEDAGALAAWIGHTAGAVVGGVTGGIAQGVASGLGATVRGGGAVILVGVALLAWWAFTKGPLKDAKVKMIPLPI